MRGIRPTYWKDMKMTTHRALKQDVRARMDRTGVPYAMARRRIEELERAPAAESYEADWGEAGYSSDSYDHSPYGPWGVTIEYYGSAEEPDEHEVLASDQRPWNSSAFPRDALLWDTAERKARIATIILAHRLGKAPTVEQVDEFVELIASGWEEDDFRVPVGQIEYALGL
jgi:hypothetical protein